MVASAMTMSAAIGSAEQPVTSGAYGLPEGVTAEAAVEIGSTVPWIGFPVGFTVSGVLLTVFGYVAMVLS